MGSYKEQTVEWAWGEDDVWQGSDYEYLVLEKRGDFPDHGGQHTVIGTRDESAGDGRHWVELFDNNFWQMRNRPDYEGEVPEGASTSFSGEEGDVSRVRRYLVDERARTYELVEEFEVPYSPIVSSVQRHDGHLVVASGTAKVFGEYDEDGTLLAQYTIDTEELLVYRVLKYDFEDFWFSGAER